VRLEAGIRRKGKVSSGAQRSGRLLTSPPPGVSFVLRFYHELEDPDDPEPVTSKDQLVERVQYVPLELDKESSDFIDRLDFLGDIFTFQRAQLPIFLDTLQKNMNNASKEGESESGEDLEPEEMDVEDV